jgi:hypothetical protein
MKTQYSVQSIYTKKKKKGQSDNAILFTVADELDRTGIVSIHYGAWPESPGVASQTGSAYPFRSSTRCTTPATGCYIAYNKGRRLKH